MFIFFLCIKCKFVYVLVIFFMNLRDKINCLMKLFIVYVCLLNIIDIVKIYIYFLYCYL